MDASNLERNLYLTTQLLELGIPMVIAMNMIDVSRKNGDKIDLKKLGNELGCEVLATSALKGEGSLEAARMAVEVARKGLLHPHFYRKNYIYSCFYSSLVFLRNTLSIIP